MTIFEIIKKIQRIQKILFGNLTHNKKRVQNLRSKYVQRLCLIKIDNSIDILEISNKNN